MGLLDGGMVLIGRRFSEHPIHKGTLIISVNTEGPPLKYHYLMGILCPSAKIVVRKFKKNGYAAHFVTPKIHQEECN